MYHRIVNFAKTGMIVTAIMVLLTFPNICINGAQNGLLLWYTKVLPVLLPFFILSSLITTKMSFSPIITTLSLGVLCGYPMGAKNIKDYYIQGYFSKKTAQKLLYISNHASPMFLIGYVLTMQLKNTIALKHFLFAIYWPPICLGIYYLIDTVRRRHNTGSINHSSNSLSNAHQNTLQNIIYPHNQHPISLDDSIERSLTLIFKIGCYIMLYSILCNLLIHIQSSAFRNHLHSHFIVSICTGLLEMTNGIANIANTSAPSIIKASCITAIASFGGCSSVSQTLSAIKGTRLSLIPYILYKLLFGLLSGLTIYIIYQTK